MILKHFSNSIKFKLFASTLLVVGIATALVSLGIYSTVLSDLQESLGLRLQHIASTGSLLIDEDAHQDIYKQYIKGVDADEISKSKSFKTIQKTLQSIKNINNLKQDIYTVVLPKWLEKNKQMLFMGMSNDKAYIGNGLERSEIASEVLNSKRATFSKIYVDSEGKWISALAPIFKVSKKTGKKRVIALIEVDYDVTEEVAEVQMKLLKKTFIWSAFGLLLSFFITFFVSNALSRPILQLTEHTKKNIDADWVDLLQIDRNDEIGTLANSMKSMVSEILVSRKQLEDYAQNLEQKVKDRTKELNDMNTKLTCILDSLGQGLFLINQDANIDPLYAKITDSFLSKPLNTMSLTDFYSEDFQVERTLNILFNEVIPFEDAVSLLPEEINKKSHDMYLDLSYKPIITDDGIDKILVIITDKTYEVLSEQKFKQKELETNRFLSIFGSQRELKSFIKDAKKRVLTSKELLRKEAINLAINLALIKGHAHTIKGGASWFYAEHIISKTTDIEKACLVSDEDTVISASSEDDLKDILLQNFNELDDNIEKFIQFANETLGYDVEGDDFISLKEGEVVSVIKDFGHDKKEELFDKLLCEDAGDILESFNNPLQDISKRLNKNINKISIKSDGSRVYRKQYGDFLDTLVHYVRNIAVHGIESENIRFERKKSKYGEIIFSVKKDNDRLLFSFKDDGNGINPELISKKCNDLGIDVSDKSEHEIIQGIFLNKVSTTDYVDEWSGLGVGMDVINSTVISMGGKAEVFSNYEEGTELIIEMPYLKYKDIDNVAT